MEDLRSYKYRGTPDCPIAFYTIKDRPKTASAAHYHRELEIIVLQKGQLDYRVDRSVLHMEAGDILIIAPNQIHGRISSTPDALLHDLIAAPEAIAMPGHHVFQKEFVQPLQNNLLRLPTLLQPDHPAYAAAAEALNKLPSYRMHEPNYKLYRYLTVVSVCVAIAPWCIPLDETLKDALPGNKAVRKAMLYIHNKCDTPLDLQSIANHVHLHPNYLCALFKAHTGKTIMQYVTQKRVDAAILLLRDTELPLEVVTEKTGFSNRSLFFRHFREITGMTPNAYRKKLLSQKL